MLRTPQASRRRVIHSGEGPTLTSRMSAAVNRGHSAGSRTSTRTTSDAVGASARGLPAGDRAAVRVAAASSLATPRWHIRSPRFAAISRSNTASSRTRSMLSTPMPSIGSRSPSSSMPWRMSTYSFNQDSSTFTQSPSTSVIANGTKRSRGCRSVLRRFSPRHDRPASRPRLSELRQHALEVGHGDTLPYHEAIRLMEDGHMRGIGSITPVAAAGGQDSHGRRAADHDVRVHDSRVGPQQQVIGEIERVLGVSRRVVAPHVQPFEIELVGLYLGAVDDLEPHTKEDVLDLLQRAGEDMLPAEGYPPARQGDVDGFCGQASPRRRPLQVRSTPGNRSLEAVPELVQLAAGRRTLCRGQGGHLVKELRHKTPTTQVGPAGLLQGVERCGIEDRPLGLARNLVEVFEFRKSHPVPSPYPHPNGEGDVKKLNRSHPQGRKRRFRGTTRLPTPDCQAQELEAGA